MKTIRRWALRRTVSTLLARAEKSPNRYATIEVGFLARRNFSGYHTGDIPDVVKLLVREQTQSVAVEDVLVMYDEMFGLLCKYLLLSASI